MQTKFRTVVVKTGILDVDFGFEEMFLLGGLDIRERELTSKVF